MATFHGPWCGVLALALATAATGNVQAAEGGLSSGLLFDSLGSGFCEPVPPGIGDEQAEAFYAQAIASDESPLRGRMQGFMEGERIGVSVFGTRSGSDGLAVVSSVMGPHPAGGHATLCLAMVQLGDVAAVPGTYAVVGAEGLDAAAPGDVLAVGWVVRLEATGRKGDGGRDVYRLARLGEVQVSDGSFTLLSIDGEQLEARMEIRGDVLAAEGAAATGFSLEARTQGDIGLEGIPSITRDE